MSLTDTIIIGAGPYGLSLAAHLKAAGVAHQILGEPMGAWRHYMPPGMLLRSEAFASSLQAPRAGFTLEDYCRLKGLPYRPLGMALPLETFVQYGLWFQANLVGETQTADVLSLRRVGDEFQLSLSDGRTLAARKVVIALGLKGFAQTPPALQGLPARYASHSERYGNLDWARGMDIAIVGGGQSALGLSALLNELGARAHVLMRESHVIWHERPQGGRRLLSRIKTPDAGLGRGWRSLFLSECPGLFHMLDPARRRQIMDHSYGASGAWWLRDRVLGKVQLSHRTELRGAAIENERVVLRVLSDGKEASVSADHVIAATGFRTDMRQHAFLSKELADAISNQGGMPDLSAHYETRVSGLYVIGPASAHSFGPVMRFVYGTKHASPTVARHLTGSLKAGTRQRAWPAAHAPLPERSGE
ncbi:NAD(P)-binding domain-containing protein [Paraburkholderia antibiotica]|uniref:Lysine N(6)-hydroxylase/L-ornithine N(5)-oxygenase family protein n=1 Tax=Paraburkholderia antibiotica TaxID=2728839 RepID=A0A7X9ZWB2_9BURK|nr:NAD(P)-binding domain-containing protein [Paraburkholderia antibiotica]NML30772.1 lysine N(6)-hydroxylase/L-ornithine N(5)-oxygenase family protein [Paraburkholderia antibiotica]